MTRNPSFAAVVATATCLVSFPAATPPARAHSDVFLAQANGQLAVGGAHEFGAVDEDFDISTRVFTGVMISSFPPFNPADYGRDEPGFIALPSGSAAMPSGASPLPSSQPVSINLAPLTIGASTDTLFYWDGVGSVNFQPISLAQPGVTLSLDPNPIGTTSSSGALHEHPVFTLDNGAAGVPADGVYLISPTASVPGLAHSDRFYMVWLVDALLEDEEAAEGLEEIFAANETVYLGKDFAFFPAAVSYVESNLIPEPATASLVVIALAAACRLRRPRSTAARMES